MPGSKPITLVVALLLVGAVAVPVAAVSEPRERPAQTSPPVQVYVSEALDISGVRLSGGGTVGTGETTFVAVGGGRTYTVSDPQNADFDGWITGAYYVRSDSDIRADLRLARPEVSSLVLYDERSRRVTGETVAPESLDRLGVRAQYNFANADRLDVSVVDPSGAEVATGRITASNEQITLDIDDPQPGVYRVTVTGSNIEAGNRTETVRVRGVTATPTATPATTTQPTSEATPTATAMPTTDAPTATTTAPSTAPATATATATPAPGTTASDGAGFGVVGVLVAVVALVALAVRRRHRL